MSDEHQRHRKKENFLRQFRDEQSKELKQLTAAQFIEIWSHYDKDGEFDRKKIILIDQSLTIVQEMDLSKDTNSTIYFENWHRLSIRTMRVRR